MTLTPRSIALATTLLFLFGVMPLRAQTIETPDVQLVRSDVERIPAGATVKLRMRDGGRLKAILFAADESGIRVKPVTRRPEPSRRITYDRIEAIERYQDRVSIGKYAGVGAAIGGSVMLILLGIAAQGY
jgi:hypothetical protein